MCGIVGVVARPGRFERRAIARALETLSHRGPDDHGIEQFSPSPHWHLWLGHTRLAILDLSPAGHQPMVRRGAGAIVFNGEVYDHGAHRAALEDSWEFRSRSDTEVLLAGVLQRGPGFVAETNAMMAAAVYDERQGHVVLARDRLGKKPLFVYRSSDVIVFASELKAIAALGVELTLDTEAISYFRWLGYVPGELTSWRECKKLAAASTATLNLLQASLPEVEPQPYWDPFSAARRAYTRSYADAVDETLALIDDATRLRLDADVPVGVFLSGGIDSGLVASSIARQHGKSVTAFIVRARKSEMDESRAAESVARKLGLPVQILEPRSETSARQFEKLSWHYDDLHAAASAIAVMANAECAREHVAVVLTGDGGDESFLGYPWTARPAKILSAMRPLRAGGLSGPLAAILRSRIGRRGLRAAVRAARLNTSTIDNKIDILLAAAGGASASKIYEFFCAATPRSMLEPEDLARLGDDDILTRARRWYPSYSWDALARRSPEELLGGLDVVTYLRDDVVQKVDRGTMAYSIEARSPFLDYRVVEHAISLPLAYKLQHNVHKRVLRDAYARRIGSELAWAPKRGFYADAPPQLPEAPIAGMRWVRGVESEWRTRWLDPATRFLGHDCG